LTTPPGPEEDWTTLLEWVRRSRGFDGRHYKPNYLRRRVAARMRAVGVPSYGKYLERLRSDPSEGDALFARLTIHVTEFFRDPEVYHALVERVLDPLRSGGGSREMKAWCAGCSTGEEPYSLALCLREWTARHPGWDFRVLATDIDEASVHAARVGDYPAASVSRLDARRVSRWFERTPERVRPLGELKGRIEFRVHDLLGGWPDGWTGFDLVFCRNLLIYLGGAQQQVLYRRFHGAMREGAALVLGKTEALLGKARRLFECIDIPNRIYRSLPGERAEDG